MRIVFQQLTGAVLLAGSLAACSRSAKSTADSAGGAVADTTAAMATTPTTTVVVTGLKVATDDKLGTYLTDASGRALYAFTKDKHDTSTCTTNCAAAWAPYTEAQATTNSDTTVDRTKIGSTTRADGTTQITYDHRPLYYYKDDVTVGQTAGQSKKGFGGSWFLVARDGNMIKAAKGAMAKVDTALKKTAKEMKPNAP